MTKDEELFRKHLTDLSDMAYRRGIVTFSDFCGLNELNIFHSCRRDFAGTDVKTFGGYDLSERQMIAFIPDALSYDWDFPIIALEIRPLNLKFSDRLSHRDYLGSLLNLGIDRGQTGDIAVMEDRAVVFVKDKMADYICSELRRVKHTSVSCKAISVSELDYRPDYEEICKTVSSVRLDSVVAVAFNISRSAASALTDEGLCFLNGRLCNSNAEHLKEGDIISVRGHGRFRLDALQGQSKKGRQYVKIMKYV